MKPEMEMAATAAPPMPGVRTGDLLELTKPRITALVLVTTLVGFYMGAQGALPLLLLLHALVGTALVAGGASALNMYLERNIDALMRRTESRPLPAGRLQSGEALLFALLLSTAGIIYLFILVNPLASLLSLITLVSYLFFYTPLKTKTWLCTLVGAVPGALPAALGWAAVEGRLDAGAWILFAILFFWQMPHFYAIGWIYRDDYARARLPMLPVIDSDGLRTGRQANLFMLALIVTTLLPTLTGIAGWYYAGGALLLGLLFLATSLLFLRARSRASARRLFFASICYLPVLLSLMVIDKVAH